MYAKSQMVEFTLVAQPPMGRIFLTKSSLLCHHYIVLHNSTNKFSEIGLPMFVNLFAARLIYQS